METTLFGNIEIDQAALEEMLYSQEVWKELKKVDEEWGLGWEVFSYLIKGIEEGLSLEQAFTEALREWDL